MLVRPFGTGTDVGGVGVGVLVGVGVAVGGGGGGVGVPLAELDQAPQLSAAPMGSAKSMRLHART
ncbi:MAG: hypothetical protein OXI33_13880 [Chloroflexota bacterium]|nr:hypothetical protein [Chloroflexota bacterium]